MSSVNVPAKSGRTVEDANVISNTLAFKSPLFIYFLFIAASEDAISKIEGNLKKR